MDVNYFGVLALTQRLLPSFRAQRRGRIVIVSSESAFAGQPANSPYCASKWAIEGWAESVAYELEHFGIEIILIEPGAYRTNIWESSPRVLPETSAYRPLLRHLEVTIDTYVAKTRCATSAFPHCRRADRKIHAFRTRQAAVEGRAQDLRPLLRTQ
jgi:NAD(P)-dependent dehydrogenase (short-subunit alcohol dehydrogenase family)